MLDLTALDMAGSAWMDEAQCLTVDPELMMPEHATEAEVEEAKAVCVGCPVLAECRAHAEGQAGAYGVHAGEWWGDEPVWEVERTCAREGCGQAFRTAVRGARQQRYCSTRCRVRSHRAESVPA